ncbi:Trm112 family protein [Vannielia sp.]|uniref:Trm112 family protein n=1 Tax=Vannielia sp. TaxID=2813045 RepID=UPI00260B21D1|nr:Trm112 family protein [Vannielia sp.]MDF1871058.1 Trm112 family protein [Vannielia sp.]
MSDEEKQPQSGVERHVLEALVCPQTQGVLRYDAAAAELISDKAGLAFPIRGGIPIMLIDEARTLDP